jgi:uncharacterized protein YdeI (YjbR/CyaY-like superfamily)
MKRAAVKKVVIENINTPGRTNIVDAKKYAAMRKVLLKVLPKKAPGLTQAELREAIQPHLPQHLWPQGEKSMWWMKTVQLDLEAKGVVIRNRHSKPARWHRQGENGDNLKRERHPMPEFVAEALKQKGLMQDYQARPPYQQNDYLGWIEQAKRKETKQKRLTQMLDELERGGVYMGMKHSSSVKQ